MVIAVFLPEIMWMEWIPAITVWIYICYFYVRQLLDLKLTQGYNKEME